MKITKEVLAQHVSFSDAESLVNAVLKGLGEDLLAWTRFLANYTFFNGTFGSSVALFAGNIGNARDVFSDPTESLAAISDRSVLVGSYFFDAARDEFDDERNPERDTHRCLAQALLKGFIRCARNQNAAFQKRFPHDADFDSILSEAKWLKDLCNRVRLGYGHGSSCDGPSLFQAMGYHLGSEVLADQEFSVIDDHLRKNHPKIVEELSTTTVRIAGVDHNAYHWLKSHSGHGDAVEFDHFQWAVQGIERAFSFTPDERLEQMLVCVFDGFRSFAVDHKTFFEASATLND